MPSVEVEQAGRRERRALVRGRLPASTAPMSRASRRAYSPPVCGHTLAPRSTATVTEVENDRTSTTTTTSLRLGEGRAPTGPHSSATGMRAERSAAGAGRAGDHASADLRQLQPAAASSTLALLRSARRCASSSSTRSWSVAAAAMSSCSRASPVAQPLQLPVQPGQLLAGRPTSAARLRGRPRPRLAPRLRQHRGERPRPAQREVLLDAAGQVAQPAVAEQRDRRVADPLQEVAVVRDDEQRARPSRRAGPPAPSACRCRGRSSARRAAARSARPSAAAAAAAGAARHRTAPRPASTARCPRSRTARTAGWR